MASRRIRVLLAHSVLERSRVSCRLAEAARTVEVPDGYGTYPSLRVDVRHERQMLDAPDVLVFQQSFSTRFSPHSATAHREEWQDLALDHDGARRGTGPHPGSGAGAQLTRRGDA
jgi:hypothetical protein